MAEDNSLENHPVMDRLEESIKNLPIGRQQAVIGALESQDQNFFETKEVGEDVPED